MAQGRWFPQRQQLPDGTRLGRLLHAGPDWQIFRVDRGNRVLIAQRPLGERWVGGGLLGDAVVQHWSFGDSLFSCLHSGADRRLEPVDGGGALESKAAGLSFALSICETRKIEADTPLHDAIYAERHSRLLPTWSVSEAVADEEVFGRWLTGGVRVSVTAFRRLASLLGWLNDGDVRELVQAAGFEVPQRPGPMRPGTERRRRDDSSDSHGAKNRAVHHGEGRGEVVQRVFRLSGRPALQSFFNEHVIDIIRDADRYKALGIDFPTAIILHGPPGCGKTFAVDKLAEYLDWPTFHIDSNSVGSPYIHETSRKIGKIFEQAIDTSPSIVVIDEMESYLSDRQIHQSTGLHHVEEVAEFLRRIPEASERQVLVIGMTNRLEMIDSAILRRGRFDHVVEVEMPAADEVTELVEELLKKMPQTGTINIKMLVDSLTGRALSDAAFVVREAARLAVRAGRSALDDASLRLALGRLPAAKQKQQKIGFVRE